MKIAHIALEIPYFEDLHYILPSPWSEKAKPGDFALVPLKEKKRIGMISQISDGEGLGTMKLRKVISIAELPWVLSPQYLHFLSWMAHYYFCSFGELIASAIPSALIPIEKDFSTDKPAQAQSSDTHLFESRNPWIWELLNPTFTLDSATDYSKKRFPLTKALFAEKNNIVWASLPEDSKNKAQNELKRALNGGLITMVMQPSHSHETIALLESPHELTEEQISVYAILSAQLRQIIAGFKNIQPFLLQGVTGSGKTEIYIRLAKAALAEGKSSLILVPEIGLTPQTVRRFAEQIPSAIFQLHSALKPETRAENWLKAFYGKAVVVIGTRSALFTPIPQLKLIIVDEEYDYSYRQNEKPFYSARDSAVKLAAECGALVILGAATPSIESLYNVACKKYRHLKMEKRMPQQKLPAVEILDLRKEPRLKKPFYLTEKVKMAVEDRLAKDEQVIFFLNRRGYASMLVCNDCDQPQFCPNCSIPLTWHRVRGEFLCHLCHYNIQTIHSCEHCMAEAMHYEGFGTQRLEKDFQELFPYALISRIDRDSAPQAHMLEEKINSIREKQVQLIIGTQMITKGHDFPNIGLVVLPMADLGLNVADYRASERTFQLVSQVSGRGGRNIDIDAQTLIQTYNPDHPVFTSLRNNDYTAFYDYEINKRFQLKQPPLWKCAVVMINDLEESKTAAAVTKIYQELRNLAPKYNIEISEPSESHIYKANKRFQQEIWLRGKSSKGIHFVLQQAFWHHAQHKNLGGARLLIKVDP